MEPRQNAPSGVTEGGRLVSRSVRLPETALLDILRADFRAHVVWSAPAEPAVVGVGSAASVTASGPGELDGVRERVESLFASVDRPGDAPAVARPRLFGGMAFHDDHTEAAPWSGFPGVAFVLPHVQVVVADSGTYLTVNEYGPGADEHSITRTLDRFEGLLADADGSDTAAGEPPGVGGEHVQTTQAEWETMVESAVARIEVGDLEKVVLAQALELDLGTPLNLADAMARFERVYPECFRFAFRANDGGTFFGPSPERLVTRRGDRLETGALASTKPRGDTDAEDEAYADELRSDPKLAREHTVVAESIREQLAGVASNVATGDRRVRKLDAMQHLFTPIAADTNRHILDLVAALHPTPAVGGRPPGRALEAIQKTETFDRGWYAAPVGWVDAAGDGTFAVAIRSALARADRADLFAGVGIVADSDPDAEWDEVKLKLRSIREYFE